MIATIVNFTTNEEAFLRHCLEEASLFSDQVIAVVCDHFFDGTPEDQERLNGIYSAHPEAQFIQYPWSKENFYSDHPTQFWHNLNRLVGTSLLKEEVETVLFLDADEIVEGERFAKWLQTFPYREYAAIRLACYWYFREANLRATEVEDTPLLIRRDQLNYDRLMQKEERKGMLNLASGKTLRFAEKENPLIHHYSWVRSREGLLKKAKTWGHRLERNWKELIEIEFSNPFSGTDFVHGYTFTEVQPFLRVSEYLSQAIPPSNVTILATRDVHKIDLSVKFGLGSISQKE